MVKKLKDVWSDLCFQFDWWWISQSNWEVELPLLAIAALAYVVSVMSAS